MRKIIQISAIAETKEEFERIYALCDDGACFYLCNPSVNSVTADWRQLPDVPQSEEPPKMYITRKYYESQETCEQKSQINTPEPK